MNMAIKKNRKAPQPSSFLEVAARNLLIEGYWRWLVYLLLFELWLAHFIPPTVLTDFPVFNKIVEWMQPFAPVLGYIGNKVTHPESVRFYVAVTLILFPLKVAYWYWWLNHDRLGGYAHLVISPLTDKTPASASDFIKEPLYRDGFTSRPKQKPRSMASRIIWSLLIVMFAGAGMTVMLIAGSTNGLVSTKAYHAMSAGGAALWFSWSIKITTFAAFLVAVSFCIIRDYAVFFRQGHFNSGDNKWANNGLLSSSSRSKKQR
jgi:hypothetical protein